MEQGTQSFCERIIAAAAIRPNKVAMTMLQSDCSEDITFRSMLDQVHRVAYRLGQAGIAFGDRVALMGENHPNWAIAYLGILFRGAVVTPLDPTAPVTTISAFLADSETRLAFVSPSSVNKFNDACAQLKRAIPAVLLQPPADGADAGNACFNLWVNDDAVPQELITPARLPTSSDLALLMYTSGTTGQPKAVPLTHGNIAAEIDAVEKVMKVTDEEVVLSVLPLFHAYSQVVNLWLAATFGARVVYFNQLGSAEIEEGLKNCGATALTGVPRLWYLFHKKIFDAVNSKPAPIRWTFKIMLLASGVLRNYARVNAGAFLFRPIHQAFGGKLRLAVSGGATFDSKVGRDFHRLGFTILQGYGLTETSGAVTATRFEDNTIGSVGTPLDGIDVKIDEPDAAGVGEVLIRGPIVTAGYYRNHEANIEAFTSDGWFRSGDLGRFDSKGHLFIVGRKKDVIVLPSGKNVFPEDVEAHYERSPLVSEICVFGTQDPACRFDGAERLRAVVVPNFEFLKSQRISNPGEWIPWELEDLGRDLPEYQRVHDFTVRAEPLPRTTTRKIRRSELQQQLAASNGSSFSKRGECSHVLSPTDAELLSSTAGRAVTGLIAKLVPDPPTIHPLLNLEIDLHLDSLARVEYFTAVEQTLGIQFEPEQTATILTVGDLAALASRVMDETKSSRFGSPDQVAQNARNSVLRNSNAYWQDVLSVTSKVIPELRPYLNRKKLVALLAYLLLRPVYVGARLLFRMDVRGLGVLTNLNGPYLICPNHQSYIDPFLVCSALPRDVLEKILHLGASRYFTGVLTSQLAKLINVVPIDPDVYLLRAMRAGAVALRAKKIVNIYPEGRRSFDGQLGVFKKGAAILATELKVPIVPVALDGTHRIWPRRSKRIRLAKVKICFGDPVLPPQHMVRHQNCEGQYEKTTEIVKGRIHRMLEQMREG